MVTVLGLEHDVIDRETYRRTVDWFRSAGVLLPTFAQLAAPDTIPAAIRQQLTTVQADEADPRNLFRVHWYNDRDRAGQAAVPVHVVLPAELTGVEAKIVVALGEEFPLVRAHKDRDRLRHNSGRKVPAPEPVGRRVEVAQAGTWRTCWKVCRLSRSMT